jgi:crossover junction endodeoxyribonuclease RuvC
MLILGIDPGTATTGYGFINITNQDLHVEKFGLIETDKNGDPGKRLINICKEISLLIKNNKPDVVAIEKLFFATNAKTAMAVGQAIGVIIYSVARAKVKIVEYAPATIKKTITGNGRADKK